MHASSPGDLPRIGERYSSDDLFERYPGYWALLAFPEGLKPDQEWNIMATPGVLVALDSNETEVWHHYLAYRQAHPDIPLYEFATEQLEELAVIGGEA